MERLSCFKWLLCLVAIVLVSACVTPVQHNTASGKPEVTINTDNAAAVKEALITRMINMGYKLVRESDNQMVFDKTIDGAWIDATTILNPFDRTTVVTRVSYTFAVGSKAVRVVADAALVAKGSSIERQIELNNYKDSLEFQEVLNQLRDALVPPEY